MCQKHGKVLCYENRKNERLGLSVCSGFACIFFSPSFRWKFWKFSSPSILFVLSLLPLLQEGTANYLKGLMLVLCYLIVAASFFVHVDPPKSKSFVNTSLSLTMGKFYRPLDCRIHKNDDSNMQLLLLQLLLLLSIRKENRDSLSVARDQIAHMKTLLITDCFFVPSRWQLGI